MPYKCVVYADHDANRMRMVTRLLTYAGYAVIPCSGEPLSNLQNVRPPEVVLLAATLAQFLHPLALALWPKVPVVVWDGSGNPNKLRAMVDAAIAKPSTSLV